VGAVAGDNIVAGGLAAYMSRAGLARIGKVMEVVHDLAGLLVGDGKGAVGMNNDLEVFVFKHSAVSGDKLSVVADLGLVNKLGAAETHGIGSISEGGNINGKKNSSSLDAEAVGLGIHFALDAHGYLVAGKLGVFKLIAVLVEDVIELVGHALSGDSGKSLTLGSALGGVDDQLNNFLSCKRHRVVNGDNVVGGVKGLGSVDLVVKRHYAAVGNLFGNGLGNRKVVKHIVMSAVDGGAADRVMSVALEQIFPGTVDVGAGIFLAVEGSKGSKRLGLVDKIVFTLVVEDFELYTGGMGSAVERVEVAVFHGGIAKLAVMNIHILGLHDLADGVHIIVHRILNKLDVVANLIHIGHHFGQVSVRLVVVLHVEGKQVIADGIRHSLLSDVVDAALHYLGIVDIVEVLMKKGECLLVKIHVGHMYRNLVDIVVIVEILRGFLSENDCAVNIEEPVGTGDLVEGAQGVKLGAVGAYPLEQRSLDDMLVGTAIENGGIDVKASVKLGHLGVLAVGSGGVARLHAAAELGSHFMTLEKVTNQRLGSNRVGLGQGVPVDHPHFLGFDKLLYALLVFGTDSQIILNDYHAAVDAEALIGILGFKDVDDVVHKVHKTELGLLGSMSPFSVPVGTADNMHRILFVTHFLSSLFAFRPACGNDPARMKRENFRGLTPARNIQMYYN